MLRNFLFLLTIVGLLLVPIGCNNAGTGGTGSGGSSGGGGDADKPKIGFIVKSMADSWFMVETKFAEQKAKELGAELDIQEAKDGDAVLNIINSMATKGVKGIIICAPQVQLGAGIQAACQEKGIKLMSVDDRLVDGNGDPIEEIPHLGISATKIGNMVGETAVAEAMARDWDVTKVGGIGVLVENLQTAVERVGGAEEKLAESGISKDQLFTAPWVGAIDIASASDAANAVITRHPEIEHWICYSSNDDGMVGAVRALEQKGVKAENIIGVGINGKLVAEEFEKGTDTGVFASVLLQASVHGGQTVEMMYNWLEHGTEPEKLTLTLGQVIKRDDYKDAIAQEGIELGQ